MTQEARGASGLAEIRARLRERGYLRGPIEGWLAGGRLASSLKAAILGGPLLGIPSAIALALANRPHFSRPGDLLVLILYASALLGAALGLLELLAESILGGLASRGAVLVGRFERTAGRVGLLFGAGASLYLALLIRSGRLTGGELWPSGLPAAVVWGGAAVVALTTGRAIGRVVRAGSMVTILTAARDGATRALTHPDSGGRRPWSLRIAGTLAVLAGILIVILLPAGREVASEPAPPVGSLPGRILVIGVDGLSAPSYARLKDAGAFPSLAAVEASGVKIPLAAEGRRIPPIVWTTLATGRPASQHGILGYEAGRLAGIDPAIQVGEPAGRRLLTPALLFPFAGASRGPVSAGLRRARTIWEIYAEGGAPTAVINWWATWPVTPGGGTQLSDRAFARLLAGKAGARDVWPPELAEDLRLRFGEDLAAAREGLGAAPFGARTPLAARGGLIDAWHARVASRILAQPGLRLGLVYLPGFDICRAEAERLGVEGEGALMSLAAGLDRLVSGLWLEGPRRDDADLLILVAEAGRGSPGSGRDAEEGFLLMTGRGLAPGSRAERASLIDLVPTLLDLGGFPPAEDLEGSSLVEIFPPDDPARARRPAIPTYGGSPADASEGQEDPFDSELIERLRSLGYIN